MKPANLMLYSALSLLSTAAIAAAPDTEAVEFYNAVTQRFFITASVSEARALDAEGAVEGWMRTGRSFQAWLAKSAAPADAREVCRFHSLIDHSHFFTASVGDCNELKSFEARERAATGNVRGWQYEGTAFYVLTPEAGQCAAGTTALTGVQYGGSAKGEGLGQRFVDDPALLELMVERSWNVDGVAFCAAAKSTGTNANLSPTTSSFGALAGTWKGLAKWESEAGGIETEATLPLELTIAADGVIGGTGNGCTFIGKVTQGDGFRSLFSSTISASGCSNAAFNGDYMRLRFERFGPRSLIARMKKGDGETEASISARLVNESASAPPSSASVGAIAGDWIGTVGWEVEAPGLPQVEVNKALSLSISSSGAVTGSGFGCNFTGTLSGNPARRSGLTGRMSAAGCDNALFNGDFDQMHLRMSHNSTHLEVRMARETAGTEVKIEGELDAKDGVSNPAPVPPASPALPGAWEGTVGWFAYERSAFHDAAVIASALERIRFTIANDGTFAGTGFGCSFAGKLVLSADGRFVSSGEITASGCTNDIFNGKYVSPEFQRGDGALEIELEREVNRATGTVKVKIAGKVGRV